MELKATLMTSEEMTRALKRISHQILENNQGADNIVFLGIRRRGVPLAKVLAGNIRTIEGREVPVGDLEPFTVTISAKYALILLFPAAIFLLI